MKLHRRTFEIALGERKDGKRTFSAVLSSETPVRRRDWEGEYLEVLSHKKGAVNLERAPLPLLESHDQRTLPIGIVDNLRIVDGKLRGDVTFGTSARAREVEADVEAGIIRNLSVGYTVEKTVEANNGNQRTITATRWTPHEVSAVAIGADAGAGFGRSANMGDEDDTTPTTNPTTTTPPRSQRDPERERCSEIVRMTRMLGDEAPTFAARLIESGASLDAARKAIIDRLAERDRIEVDTRIRSEDLLGGGGGFEAIRGRITPGVDNSAEFRAAAVDAILLRSGIHLAKPHPAARDVSASVFDLARTCLSRAGKTVTGSNEELLRRAMNTGDFPLILADAMHKAVRNGYESEPASHRAWVRTQGVQDFRDQHRPILGSAPALEHVNEGGEYTNGPLSEDSTSYRVAKYGKIVTLTWEALVNDDIGAFIRIKPAMGMAARRLEADIVYSLFGLNGGAGPTMQDSKALFHDDHDNLGTAADDFDAAALGAARAMLRKQTALGGGYLSLVPRYLIIPVEYEQQAEVLVAQATRAVTTVDSATPRWIASLEIVVEPRLAEGAFYLAADSSQIDHCELGLLEENMDGPLVTEDLSQEFRRDVFSWKVRHVVGAKFLDWRGIVKQPISGSGGGQ